MRLRIAGVVLGITSDDPSLDARVSAAARLFLEPRARADVVLSVAWGHLEVTGADWLVFDSGSAWRLYRLADRPLFEFTAPTLGPAPYKRAEFDPDFTRGAVTMHRPYFRAGQPVFPVEYPLDELLLINLLARHEGIEVHASGVIDHDGRGYLFAGASGAGKTTMARLWARDGRVTVMSDDRVVLRRTAEGIRVFGTPWHGDAGLVSPASAPLSGLFFLDHARAPATRRLDRAEAAAALVATAFLPFYDATGLARALESVDAITATVPVHRLGFSPDSSVLDVVRRAGTRAPA